VDARTRGADAEPLAMEAGRFRPLVRGVAGLTLAAMAAFVLIRMGLYELALPAPTVIAVTATSFVLFALAAPLACVFAAWVAPRHERAGWVLLALGSGLMVAGDAVALATGGTGALGAAPSLPSATVVWASSFVAFFLAALSFLGPIEQTGAARTRRALDIALLVLIVAALVYVVALYPAYGQDPDARIADALMSYTSLVLSVSLVVLVMLSRPQPRQWHPPLAVALGAIAIGSLVQVFATPITGVAVPGLVARTADLPWLVAYGMLTLAAVVRLRRRGIVLAPRADRRPPGHAWMPIAMMSATFVAMPAFIYLGIAWQGDPLGYWVFAGLASLLGLVAVARNVVLTLENVSLRTRALIDPLTGLYNHRYFQEQLEIELARAAREGTPLSLVCIDLDDFDQVNNVYGHAAGDHRLRAVASGLVTAARSTDIVCRIGGDEFALVMPGTSAIDAYKTCLRLQDAARDADAGCPLPAGFSAGIAAVPEHAESREDLTHKADGALYWAKFHGRQQVVVYDPNLVVALGPEQRIGLLETESYVRMVQLLASAVDARDPYTQQHSRRVAALAVQFARAFGMPDDRVSRIETAALLHDVGKIGVSDAILRKNGRLTDDEYEQVKEHPNLAARILKAIPRAEILPWILGHHERWDGRGYPDGLAEDDIPLEARILAICDAFDAMTTSRPYRDAMSTEEALEEVTNCAGTQFDEELADMFVVLVRDLERVAARTEKEALLDEATVA